MSRLDEEKLSVILTVDEWSSAIGALKEKKKVLGAVLEDNQEEHMDSAYKEEHRKVSGILAKLTSGNHVKEGSN